MGFNLTEISNKTVPTTPTSDSRFKVDDLVKVPFREGYFVVETGSMSFKDGGYHSNEDGSDTAILVTVPAGINNGARMRFPFYGRKFGVRWQRDNSQCDFTVMIDGVAYSVSGTDSFYVNESVSLTDGEALIVIEDSLPDGIHYADIQVSAPTTGTNSLTLFGFLAERRAGYESRPRANSINGPFSTPTTSTGIARGNAPLKLKTIRKIIYTNTTASPITISITYNGTVIWSKSVLANDTLEWDCGANTTIPSSLLNHLASAVGLNYTLIGGY